MRFEGVPGEFSQHDFGSVNITYADGTGEKIHFFASRLKYSRWTHVVTVPDEKVEPLIRALLKAFESFGGVPLRAVFDNPKTIVLSTEHFSVDGTLIQSFASLKSLRPIGTKDTKVSDGADDDDKGNAAGSVSFAVTRQPAPGRNEKSGLARCRQYGIAWASLPHPTGEIWWTPMMHNIRL